MMIIYPQILKAAGISSKKKMPKSTEERQALFQRLGTGSWQIFGGHGGKKEYNV